MIFIQSKVTLTFTLCPSHPSPQNNHSPHSSQKYSHTGKQIILSRNPSTHVQRTIHTDSMMVLHSSQELHIMDHSSHQSWRTSSDDTGLCAGSVSTVSGDGTVMDSRSRKKSRKNSDSSRIVRSKNVEWRNSSTDVMNIHSRPLLSGTGISIRSDAGSIWIERIARWIRSTWNPSCGYSLSSGTSDSSTKGSEYHSTHGSSRLRFRTSKSRWMIHIRRWMILLLRWSSDQNLHMAHSLLWRILNENSFSENIKNLEHGKYHEENLKNEKQKNNVSKEKSSKRQDWKYQITLLSIQV